MKNLLIEGMPGCGKSTAILQSLKEAGLLPYCAGYRTVRVFGTGSLLRGFAQVQAGTPAEGLPGYFLSEFMDTGGFNAAEDGKTLSTESGRNVKEEELLLPETELVTDAPVRNLFLDFSKVPPLQKDVFLNFTRKSLQPYGKNGLPYPGAPAGENGARLILMDEIGGRELELPEVRDVFLAALTGPLPVIGVLKCPEHARHFSFPAYEAFRDRVEKETETEVYAMTEQTRAEAREHIRAWLKQYPGNPLT